MGELDFFLKIPIPILSFDKLGMGFLCLWLMSKNIFCQNTHSNSPIYICWNGLCPLFYVIKSCQERIESPIPIPKQRKGIIRMRIFKKKSFCNHYDYRNPIPMIIKMRKGMGFCEKHVGPMLICGFSVDI